MLWTHHSRPRVWRFCSILASLARASGAALSDVRMPLFCHHGQPASLAFPDRGNVYHIGSSSLVRLPTSVIHAIVPLARILDRSINALCSANGSSLPCVFLLTFARVFYGGFGRFTSLGSLLLCSPLAVPAGTSKGCRFFASSWP
ncbi:hypothetical protein R1flu_005013 [Riccia fluitans]|uniref:Secreted protein n=1 Tax=Riccia fluitans TaxID=41844 RepID=A0ABD1YUS1_9MARC